MIILNKNSDYFLRKNSEKISEKIIITINESISYSADAKRVFIKINLSEINSNITSCFCIHLTYLLYV